jgi:TonB family protein
VKSHYLFPQFVAIALLVATGSSAPQAQEGSQSQKQGATSKQASELKLIKSPVVSYPVEALQKNIEGTVTLHITVNANGRVSDAKALSGPAELFQAALDNVKQWEFWPPAHAPVEANVEVSFWHPREEYCPRPESEYGEVMASGTLRSAKGTVVSVTNAIDWLLPEYSPEDRKVGLAGEMILYVTVDAEGKVANVRVGASLSPRLDNAAVDSVRNLKFKLISGKPDALPDDFPMHISFRATCSPNFKPK